MAGGANSCVAGDSASVVATSTARRMHRLLASTPARGGALALFVAGLSQDDETHLAQLLSQTEIAVD